MSNEDILETYLNGNISDARKHVQRMSKEQFFNFLEFAIDDGLSFNELRALVR
jgi:hypothetical protein